MSVLSGFTEFATTGASKPLFDLDASEVIHICDHIEPVEKLGLPSKAA